MLQTGTKWIEQYLLGGKGDPQKIVQGSKFWLYR